MKPNIKNRNSSLRHAFVLVLALAMVCSAVGSGWLQFLSSDRNPSAFGSHRQAEFNGELPENTTNRMSTDGSRNEIENAFLSPVFNIPSSNNEIKNHFFSKYHAKINCGRYLKNSATQVYSSSAQVSSRLGRLFTLVGAKPSGTG